MAYGYIDNFGEYCEGYEEQYYVHPRFKRRRKKLSQYKNLPDALKGVRYFLNDRKITNIEKQNSVIFNYWFEFLTCIFQCKNEDQMFIKIAEYIQLDFVKFVKHVRKNYK